jgi:hypothetical protein
MLCVKPPEPLPKQVQQTMGVAAAHVAAAAAAEAESEILGCPPSSTDLSAHGGARVRLSAGMVAIVQSGDFLSFYRPRSDVAVEESDTGARKK